MWECQTCKKQNVDRVKRCVLCATLLPSEKTGTYAEESFANPIKNKVMYTYMFFVGLLIIVGYFNFSKLMEFSNSFIQKINEVKIRAQSVLAEQVQVELTSLIPIKKPTRYFVNKWNVLNEQVPMYLKGKECSNAIGLYIPSREMKQTSQSAVLVYQIDGKYGKITFDIGCDSNWNSGYRCGTYSLDIYADEAMIWGTGFKDRNYYGKGITIQIPNGAKMLKIVLTEKKGSDGTQNVVIVGKLWGRFSRLHW